MAKLRNVFVIISERGVLVLLKAIFNLCHASFIKYILREKHICKKIFNYKMYLDLFDPGISRSLILFSEREIDHKIILEKILKPGMTVFDIGANVGYYALMELDLIGSSGKLLAIEPSPNNIELLNRNLILNNYFDINVINGAVSDISSTREFFLSDFSNLNTFHNVGTGVKHLSGKKINVKTYTVPDLAKKYGKPDLIRMDVEGHEVEVLNGMIELIKDNEINPMIIFETHLTRYNKDHDMELSLRALFDHGYKTKYLASSSERKTNIINKMDYKKSNIIKTDGVIRRIYEDIDNEDAIQLICHKGGARTIFLTNK